jgi:hypothetical protein
MLLALPPRAEVGRPRIDDGNVLNGIFTRAFDWLQVDGYAYTPWALLNSLNIYD